MFEFEFGFAFGLRCGSSSWYAGGETRDEESGAGINIDICAADGCSGVDTDCLTGSCCFAEVCSGKASSSLSKSTSRSISIPGVGVNSDSDSGLETDLAPKCKSPITSLSATVVVACLSGGLVVRVETEEAFETRDGVEWTEGEESVEVGKKVLSSVLVESLVFEVLLARCRGGVVKSGGGDSGGAGLVLVTNADLACVI